MRKSVKEFAEEMEKVMKRNSRKRGWQDLHFIVLLDRLKHEVDELYFEVRKHNYYCADITNLERIMHESVDVANYAMMINRNASKDLGKLRNKLLKEDG